MALPENRLAAVSRQWALLPDELHSLIRSFAREPTPTAVIIKDFFKLVDQLRDFNCETVAKGGIIHQQACVAARLIGSAAPTMSSHLRCLVMWPDVYFGERCWPDLHIYCLSLSRTREDCSLYTEYNG